MISGFLLLIKYKTFGISVNEDKRVQRIVGRRPIRANRY